MASLVQLPIDAILPQVIASLREQPNLVIEAPPGAGKTTRVPPALLSVVAGTVLVLEPRRIAARLAARRVASESGERVGQTVGYQVRFEEVAGPRTRLRFVTGGVLTRRLLADPDLCGPDLRRVDAVVLDEFHERHLDTDLALALLKQLQRRRPELLLVVMSATLNAGPIATYLDNCPVLRSEGRLFQLSIRHLPYSPDPLPIQVRNAVDLLTNSDGAAITTGETTGDILAFLPGAAEIRKSMRECEPAARRANMIVFPLHGDLSPAEQDRAVAPHLQRKLILSTNVAESSVTIEGVNAVIDSGLARVATYSVWSGLPSLEITRISKASATQRAGRAGRTGPGRVLRLYSREDYALRPDYDTPEIARSDLSQLCLALRAAGLSVRDLDWFEPPPEAAVRRAEALLDRLGATGPRAAELARYPLTPRLARVLVESLKLGVGEAGCLAAAILDTGSDSRSGLRSDRTDLLAAIESSRDTPQDSHPAARLAQHIKQLRRLARRPHLDTRDPQIHDPQIHDPKTHDDDALLLSVLAGFPDRVARRRAGNQVLLSAGGSAEVAAEMPSYEFMVALDTEDRKEHALPRVRMTARVEPEWLLDLFPDHIREQSTLSWNHAAERVEARSALLYDELIIQESQTTHADPEAVADLLSQKVIETGIAQFVDAEALANLIARADFAGCEPLSIRTAVLTLCSGLRSFADVRRAAPQLLPILEQMSDRRRLQDLAPAIIRLQSGRTTKIHYELGKPPWIASRLQDFFGMHTTPAIGPNHTPLVVHLLGPNQRAVQTTADLSGFWERLYPQVRRELMRRYPKHAWPEQP